MEIRLVGVRFGFPDGGRSPGATGAAGSPGITDTAAAGDNGPDEPLLTPGGVAVGVVRVGAAELPPGLAAGSSGPFAATAGLT